MRHVTVQRGALLASGRRFWVMWDGSDRLPLCLPVRHGTVPRSRWDYRLRDGDAPSLAGHALMICGDKARRFDTSGLTIVGALSAACLATVETMLRRAAESEAVEARYRL